MSSKVIAGRYELVEKIGDGGMAVVYKAKDRLLSRMVAVKILKPQFTNDEKFIDSFRKESRAAASLSHPNIVNIYDVGKEGNINYIVMELIEGKPLSEIIKDEAPLNYKRVIDYAKQIASGLSAAHKHGIIHRDVKPHNILVNEDGIAKIADFGIAKAITTTTIAYGTNETVMGSVHYFSPEQARGGYVDEKSDIYSLGIVMYEMLTGEVPFDGDNPVSVALMHINDSVVPPSRLVTGIPPGLERIVMKATDKYQSNRFKSADEVIDALNSIDLVSRVVGSSIFMGGDEAVPTHEFQTEPVRKEMQSFNSPRNDKLSDQRSSAADEDNTDSDSHRKKRRKKAIIVAAIALLVIGGLLTGAYIMGMIGPKDIKVPDFKGKTIEKAEKTAEKKELKLHVAGYKKSDKYETGEIMKQDPSAGTMVRKNHTIDIYISKGSDEAVVPNIVGFYEDEAVNILEEAGYKVIEKEVTDTSPEGQVISQDPAGGEKARKGEKVTIRISNGQGKETVKVPSLLGLSESKAKSRLKKAHLKAGSISSEYSDVYSKGTVMKQEREAGEQVDEGTEIGFTISKGQKEEKKEEKKKEEPVSDTGKVAVNIDFEPAKQDVFYMTVTVSDSSGNTRYILKNEQEQKSAQDKTLDISGKGKGKITVIFDDEVVYTWNADFAKGELY